MTQINKEFAVRGYPGKTSSNMIEINQELDVRGYNCPIPLLCTKKALGGMAAGERLRVLTTDPGSVIHFRVYTEASGHALLSCDETGGAFCFVIEKRAA